MIGVSGSLLSAPAWATPQPVAEDVEAIEGVIPEEDREDTLGDGWEQSGDLAWTSAGDAFGFALLTAKESEGYAWGTLASFSRPDIDTDSWIGNVCLTGDGKTFAVVYGPRTFTNDAVLFTRGGFAALVDAESGATTDLGQGYSLAYFNPGCGAADEIVLSQFDDEVTQTRVTTVSGETKAVEGDPVLVDAQLTSLVPSASGTVAAAGSSVVRVGSDGALEELVKGDGLAYGLTSAGENDVAYLTDQADERDTSDETVDLDTASLHYLPMSAEGEPSEVIDLAVGDITDLGISADTTGTVYITGDDPTVRKQLPDNVDVLDVDSDAILSSEGNLAVETTLPSEPSNGTSDSEQPRSIVTIEAVATESTTDVAFTVAPSIDSAATETAAMSALNTSTTPSPGVAPTGSAFGTASATNPVEAERTCAIPRNDPTKQALQPKPRQVEWFVDQAVKRTNVITREQNYLNSGMPEYNPQALFPLPTIAGGTATTPGQIPAQVMLGILAQESNLWQASRTVVPGVTGNPLIGNYYGVNNAYEGTSNWWKVTFNDADCGYGVAQVTDGMRLAGREQGRVTALPYDSQLAVALDFTANIAAGMQILAKKWNETRAAGLTINDGKPQYLENWFFAVWAYNSGFYPQGAAGQPWGVGWLNNPINPLYPPNRHAFLDGSPADASHPQDWPYPEKVMGFAAHSLELLESPNTYVAGFRTAWWTAADGNQGMTSRTMVKPPRDLFCKAANSCDPTSAANTCYHIGPEGTFDSKCWYNGNAKWKDDCSNFCGREFIRFTSPTYNDPQPDGTAYLPSCVTTGLPTNTKIVDNVPNGTQASRSCGEIPTQGTFGFTFAGDEFGDRPSKMDLHQLGAGFNGHFYFAHTRTPDGVPKMPPGKGGWHGGKLKITGKWTLGSSTTSWHRVLVHMPDHGAWTQQACYSINPGSGTSQTRCVLQRHYANQWVSLGVFKMSGNPSVSLSNETKNGIGVDDIAWDAVAFVPLANKPNNFVVALGDSYSSGEGTSTDDGADFYRDSDHHGDYKVADGQPLQTTQRNACHRSKEAYIRKTILPGTSATLGSLADSWSASTDLQFLACSGAETEHMLPFHSVPAALNPPVNADGDPGDLGRFGELSQLDRGFLDSNTTLVTLTIGGNDLGFGPIIQQCILSIAIYPNCELTSPPGGGPGLMRDWVSNRMATIQQSVGAVLEAIKTRAPNAKIVLLGYPKLFADGTICVLIDETSKTWLNAVADELSTKLTMAAAGAGSRVRFVRVEEAFAGRNVCSENRAIQRVVTYLTPGDEPGIPGLPSAQSIHPSKAGTGLYASALSAGLIGFYQ